MTDAPIRTQRFRSEDLTDSTRTRLLAKAVFGANGCMIWTGSVSAAGYGYLGVNGRRVLVHRLAYELFVGPIPEALGIDHVCHTRDDSCGGGDTCLHRRCCNPAHLEAVTQGENSRRGVRARRSTCVHGHPYDEANTALRVHTNPATGATGVSRRCKACHRLRMRAVKAVRTTCAAGHELTLENTLPNRSGSRKCKICFERAVAGMTGALSPNSALTAGQVKEIRSLVASGLTHAQAAARFDISKHTVRSIIRGRTYRNVPSDPPIRNGAPGDSGWTAECCTPTEDQ